MGNIINLIRGLIANGELKKALEELVGNFQNHKSKDSVLILSSRYNKLNEKKVSGILLAEEIFKEENKIVHNLLIFLNTLEEEELNKREEVHGEVVEIGSDEALSDISILKKLSEILNRSRQSFIAQAKIREKLYNSIKERLKIKESLQYEDFFHKYYSEMDQNELEYHKSIRDYTEKILNIYNRQILELIIGNHSLKKEMPELIALERYLLVWLGKFERLFKNTPSICLVYVGVDEGNPIPM